jgi:hypothetical protein
MTEDSGVEFKKKRKRKGEVRKSTIDTLEAEEPMKKTENR